MTLNEKKTNFLKMVEQEVQNDAFLEGSCISIAVIGSFLGDSWNPQNSDIDIVCYTKRKKDSYKVFKRIIDILNKANQTYLLYPLGHHTVFSNIIKELEELEEYLLIVPFHFIGFHIMVFSKDDFDFETGKVNSWFLKLLTTFIFPPAIFIESILSEHKTVLGKDIVGKVKTVAPSHPRAIFNLSKALLWVGLFLVWIKPKVALGWLIKASRSAYRNVEFQQDMNKTKFIKTAFLEKHIHTTLSFKKHYYSKRKYTTREVYGYWRASKEFINLLERTS
jgi:predicted nucleotidyltransferase